MENRRYQRVQQKNAIIACTRKFLANFDETTGISTKMNGFLLIILYLENFPFFRSYPLNNGLCCCICEYYDSTDKFFIYK